MQRKSSVSRLTLAELEAATCTRLTGLLTLNFTSVAGEESGGLQSCTIGLFVNLAKCAGDSKPYGLCLTFGTTSHEGYLDVKLTCCTGYLKCLVGDVLEGSLLEVLFHGAVVDNELAGAGYNINTSDSFFTSSKGVFLFHVLCLDFVKLNGFRVLCLLLVLRACINVQVIDELVPETGLRKHTAHRHTDEFLGP